MNTVHFVSSSDRGVTSNLSAVGAGIGTQRRRVASTPMVSQKCVTPSLCGMFKGSQYSPSTGMVLGPGSSSPHPSQHPPDRYAKPLQLSCPCDIHLGAPDGMEGCECATTLRCTQPLRRCTHVHDLDEPAQVRCREQYVFADRPGGQPWRSPPPIPHTRQPTYQTSKGGRQHEVIEVLAGRW